MARYKIPGYGGQNRDTARAHAKLAKWLTNRTGGTDENNQTTAVHVPEVRACVAAEATSEAGHVPEV